MGVVAAVVLGREVDGFVVGTRFVNVTSGRGVVVAMLRFVVVIVVAFAAFVVRTGFFVVGRRVVVVVRTLLVVATAVVVGTGAFVICRLRSKVRR
jgi:hypothetical protein